MNVPPIEVIIRLNALLIEQFGGERSGPDNFLNRGSLEWALEIIQSQVFGYDPYPTLAHKAAVLAWTIISGHVFFDGNKRTGMATAYLFIRANGQEVRASDDETVQIALDIAQRSMTGITLDDVTAWFRRHIV